MMCFPLFAIIWKSISPTNRHCYRWLNYFSHNKIEPTELSPMDKNLNLGVNLIIIKEKIYMTWKFCFRRHLPQKQFMADLLSTVRVSKTARMVFYANVPSNLSVLREFSFTYSHHTKNIFWNSILKYWALPEYMPLYHYFF